MKIQDLKVGIHRAQICDSLGTIEFNLSVIDWIGGKAVAGFSGNKPPRKGKHLLLSDNVRNWIDKIELKPL